jgi:hypothetical protein
MSLFVEDVNSWVWGTQEFHKNGAITNSYDSTVYPRFLKVRVVSILVCPSIAPELCHYQ